MRKIISPFDIIFILSVHLNSQSLFEEALFQTDSASDETLQLNGFIRSAAYAGRYADENTVHFKSIYSQFGLIADLNIGEHGSAYAEMRYRSGREYENSFSEVQLREAYVDVYLGPVDIRVGKQIVSWGASSFLNPSDQFSAQDPTFRSPNHDDLRLGTWAVRTNLTINSSSKLQVLWMPDYVPSVLLTEPFAFPNYISFAEDVRPSQKIKEGSFGLNYDLRTRFLDLGLSYFNGYRNNPSIQMDTAIFNFTTLSPDLIQLRKTPYRIHSAGFNLTVPVGSYLFRTEAAWMSPMEDETLALPFSELSYTAEVEQSGNNITLIGGYYGKYILDYKELSVETIGITDEFPDVTTLFPPGTPMDMTMIQSYTGSQIEGFNRLYNYQNEEFYHSAYVSVTISMFYNLVDLELPCMYNFTSEELTLMPSLKFNITDGLSVQFGAYYLYGKKNSIYNLSGPVLNAGYGLIQYKF
ncbi:MAG: hypothetical protein PF450_16975 [Bacteroidales bacterium]|jgi:hypothetical protein|nr:hypothetical protein [Bacteroidales bacterium]